MDYIFKPGERVKVIAAHDAFKNYAGGTGAVVTMDNNGPSTADGFRTARVRIKLDNWSRPLWFPANLVNPV